MALILNNVTKRFDGQTADTAVLRGISLQLERGSSLALTGESGSGKSTLLHLAAALDRCDDGEISLDGQRYDNLTDFELSKLRRRVISVVFQQFNLIPSLTVQANIELHARIGDQFDIDWCGALTDRLGLSTLQNRYPEQLSGGQQQRVAIARALAIKPALLLADEPTGNLDETISLEVIDLMQELVKEHSTALFLVTHSTQIANRLDRQIHLKQGLISK